MALIKSPLFDGLWGKIGSLEFRMRKNKKIELAKKRIPTDRKSEAQLKQRERYKNCLQQYYNLTPEQLKQYEEIGRKQKLDAFRAFMAECLKAPIGLTFDNDGGGTWNRYINIPITAAPAEYAQYRIELNGDTISIYSADGTLKTQGTGMLDFWNNVKSDGSDIRAFDNSQNYNQLYFWIESWDYTNQTATIWVRVEANITELNIAYGNSLATKSAYENGEMVFEFFDDFEDGVLDANKWTTAGTGTVTESNGELVVSSAGDNSSTKAYSNVNFAPNSVLRYKRLMDYESLVGFEDSAESSDDVIDWHTTTTVNEWRLGARAGGSTWAYYTIGTPDTSNYHVDTLIWTSTEVKILVDDSYAGSVTTNIPTVSIPVKIRAWGSTVRSVHIDWIFVAKLADPANFGTPTIVTL